MFWQVPGRCSANLARGEISAAIINYGVGNLLSISVALKRAGASPTIVENLREAEGCDALILPGVGAFKPAIMKLRENEDLALRLLNEKPTMGICLGMQLLYERSEEGCRPGERLRGLGVFKGDVKRFPPSVKIPQMGWNTIRILRRDCPLLSEVPDGAYVYYANSYAAEPSEHTAAITEYGIRIAAVVHKSNIFGTQFHPEKSGKWGSKILENFIAFAKEWMR